MNPYESHKVPDSGGLYLKLKDGETVKMRLATEPYIFQSNFQDKYATRYAWVVFNHDEDVAQVWQASPTTFRAIQGYATDSDYGDPTEYDIKVTRSGTGTDTTYTVIASPKKAALTPEQQAKVDKIKITEVKGLEHALPLTQIQDGNNAPKPPPSAENAAAILGGTVVEDRPPMTNYDELPF